MIVEGVAAHARVQQVEVGGLRKFLEEAQSTLESMEECAF